MRRVAVILGAVCIVALGWIVAGRQQPQRGGVSSEGTTDEGAAERLTPEQERELHRIADLGYITGRAPAREAAGVLRHDASLTSGGCTLFTFAWGPEAVLIDEDGSVRHSWSVVGSDYWARAHVCPGGELLVITSDPSHLMRIDRDSNVMWISERTAHHDLDVLEDGSMWVLVREATTRPHIHDGAWLLDDVLVRFDPEGREFERVSLLEAFERTDRYRGWVAEGQLPEGTDIFHTNSIEVQEGSRRALVSIRSLDAVAMLDLDSATVEWARRGPWRMQHEAQLVGGNLLVFDNAGLGEQSRVLEVDLETATPVWSYTAPGFLSRGAGAQQRLPDGNTLISESEAGRIIEVTQSGEIVWEYVNPRTVGGRGRERSE